MKKLRVGKRREKEKEDSEGAGYKECKEEGEEEKVKRRKEGK